MKNANPAHSVKESHSILTGRILCQNPSQGTELEEEEDQREHVHQEQGQLQPCLRISPESCVGSPDWTGLMHACFDPIG